MTAQIVNIVEIYPEYSDGEYFYTVEDKNIDIGVDGITISYWHMHEGQRNRAEYLSLDTNSAKAIAKAIQRLYPN